MFGWGQATGNTGPLGDTLIAFAPGMIMFSLHYMVLRGFYSIEDTRTPFFIQCVIALVNSVLTITFATLAEPAFVAPALALAYGCAYFVGALLSMTVLSHRLGGLGGRRLLVFMGRTALAAVPAATVAWLVLAGLEAVGLDVSSRLDSLVLLAVGAVVGVGGYVVSARLLRIDEVSRILSVIRTRLGRRRVVTR
jgi:putative peptidoglycan lipid II flippase